MDEPTNFLDMDSIDSLIAATNKYSGALLLVSHNRTFLNKCARQFLSVVPGKFEIFSDLKQCERATYQFIEEMESGTKVNTASLVQKNPSADASAKVRDGSVPVEKKESDGGFVLNISEHVVRDAKTEIKAKKPVAAAAPAAAAAASIPAEELKLVGSACLAVWAADGGRYPAIITKAVSKGKVEVSYNGYNEKAVLNIKDLMIKGSAKPAAASKPQQQQRRTRRGSEKA
jgi:energy-coupling factor transporter ATP-binding protein EcfA2